MELLPTYVLCCWYVLYVPYIPLLVCAKRKLHILPSIIHTLESYQISWQKTFQTHAWSEGHTSCQIDTNPTDQRWVYARFWSVDISWFLCSFSVKWRSTWPKSQKWQVLSHSCVWSPSDRPGFMLDGSHVTPNAFKSRQMKRITDSPWQNSERQSNQWQMPNILHLNRMRSMAPAAPSF